MSKNAKNQYEIWLSTCFIGIEDFYRKKPNLNITNDLMQSLNQARQGKGCENLILKLQEKIK